MSSDLAGDTMRVEIDLREAGARLLEVSYLLGEVAPVYSDAHRHACKAVLGQDLAIVLPTLLSDVGRFGFKNITEALPYVRFLKESADYVLGLGPFPSTASEPAAVARKRVRKILKSMHVEELRP